MTSRATPPLATHGFKMMRECPMGGLASIWNDSSAGEAKTSLSGTLAVSVEESSHGAAVALDS
ncbi:hypothetical protein FH972_024602 [Carpinus fangiana]|uniref:Uncharacterized protein n=1 Tax=Carpinus fangiana TaxID=176857 RepID=A0A5N6KYG6_9ROSI|nr:hypothetical protein FH972_024602 [Carpinus fangiana]